MRQIVLAIVTAVSFVSIAVAEPLRIENTEKTTPPGKPPPARRAFNSCAAYGAGFVKIDGTDTCVKVGGAVSVGVGGAVGSH